MRHNILIIILLFVANLSLSAQFSASGGIGQPYAEKPSGGSIEAVYFFNTLSGATLRYESSSGASITFIKYDLSGNQTTVPPSDITNLSAGIYEIRNLQDGYGYLAQEESKAIWVIDYSLHTISINSITPQTPENEDERCGSGVSLPLLIDKTDSKLQYRTWGGEVITLERKFTVEWTTLKWDEDAKEFVEIQGGNGKESAIHDSYQATAPLKNTTFTVSGDQYARNLGIPQSATSEEYEAVNIEAYIVAHEIEDGIENDTLSTDGSAPITRRFYGYANEPVAYHYDWYIYKNGDKTNYLARFQNETDITYTFTEAGKYEVELIVSSMNNICQISTSLDEFEISESSLEIPNFFSPGTSPGFNDEFKVKYKSLVKFKATIFNRWGNKLYEWNDPEQGWDGKYNGKYVSPGVYFYIIDATGSEGKRYKKGGDINIVRGK